MRQSHQHRAGVSDFDFVITAGQARESVHAAGVSDRAGNDFARAVFQGHGDACNALIPCVKCAVAIGVQVNLVADGEIRRSVGLITKIRIHKHIPWGQQYWLGEFVIHCGVRVASLGITGGWRHFHRVRAGGQIIENITAIRPSLPGGYHVIVHAIAVRVVAQGHGDIA